MDKVKKRITIRGVLDGLRSVAGSTPKAELEIEETLRSGHFQLAKTIRHGFPYKPTALAYDPVQNLLAIGTANGSIRLFGRPGVDVHIEHEGETCVLQILFLVNQGGMVTICDDHRVHLWDIRKKTPTIAHTLKFHRERITFGHHPFQSKWIYIGTEKGNVHIIKTEGFVLSGYVINWNKAIELLQKSHPGAVIHLSENPVDPNKLLIGFESGVLVLWDLKLKIAEARFNSPEKLTSVCWNNEGKMFMCSHRDGSLSTWNIKIAQKPQNIIMPHAKLGKDEKPDPCHTIEKLEWKSIRNGEPYIIFSGGMPQEKTGRCPCLTVMHSKNTTVLEMEHEIIDFISLCSTPWKNDFQDPFAIVVLLQNDLVVIDLTSQGYPCFENPYPMDIHESPVTACVYLANCAPHLIPAFYHVGSKQKKAGYSTEEWPIKGGETGPTTFSYHEIIITGHADGSLKFWDASAVTLHILYKLKTAKLFDKNRCMSPDADDDPFAIQLIHFCPESRLLSVAGLTHVILFKFSTSESSIECPTLDISIVYEIADDLDPVLDPTTAPSKPSGIPHQSSSIGSYSSVASDGKEKLCCVTARSSSRKWSPGYQPELCAVLSWINGEPPPPITSLSLNSSYGLMAFANECGICIIDYIQKTSLLTMGTPDLYGPMDPYSRAPHSPKNKNRPAGLEGLTQAYAQDESRSPTQDQTQNDLPSPNVFSSPPALDTIQEGHTHFFPSNHGNTLSAKGLESITEDPVAPPRRRSKKRPTMASQNDETEQEVNNTATRTQPDGENSSTSESVNAAETSSNTKDSCLTAHQPAKLTNCHSGSHSNGKNLCENNNRVTFHPPEDRNFCLPSEKPGASEDTTSHKRKGSLLDKLRRARREDKTTDAAVTATTPNDPSSSSTLEPDTSSAERKYKSNPDLSCERDSAQLPAMSRVLSVPDGAAADQHRLRSFVRKVSRSLRVSSSRRDEEEAAPRRFQVLDLTASDCPQNPPCRKMTYRDHLAYDKTDGSFSRSRSSSMSSLENISHEAIQCLVFADAFTRKTDCYTYPCLWVGTVLGSVLIISISLPDEGDRNSQPVIVSPSGTIFRLKGSILEMSFLDCNGILIPASAEQWKDDIPKDSGKKPYYRQQSVQSIKNRMSPTSSQEMSTTMDRQLAILVSERHARVITLPSQTVAYKMQITETSVVSKAEVISVKDSVCLGCYVANGHVMIMSLPSLKSLIDVDFIPSPNVRIAKTFCFSNNGHALYFSSPTEVQKMTFSADICENLKEMLPDLFKATETPEAPKQNFFKNLFTGGPAVLDREALFGSEGSGKASSGVAKYTAGTGQIQAQAGNAMSEIAVARRAAEERGRKLAETEEASERMRNEAMVYAQRTKEIVQKQRDKKWYQF